jgi:hypothetical protein
VPDPGKNRHPGTLGAGGEVNMADVKEIPETLEVIAKWIAREERIEPEDLLRVLVAVADDRELAAAIEREILEPVTFGQVVAAAERRVAGRIAREADVDQRVAEGLLRHLDGAFGILEAVCREVVGGEPVSWSELHRGLMLKEGRFVSSPEPKSREELLMERLLRYAAVKGYDRVQIKPGAFKTRDLSALRRRYPFRPELEAELRRLAEAGVKDPLRVLSERHERRAARAQTVEDRLLRLGHHERAAVERRRLAAAWFHRQDADEPVPEYELLEPSPQAAERGRRREEFVRKLRGAADGEPK